MKRTISLFVLALVVCASVGCGPKLGDKAAEWLLANGAQVVCADEERHSLYYFDANSNDIFENRKYKNRVHITKVDLLTGEAKPLSFYGGSVANEPVFNYYLLPEDRGINNPEATFVVSTSNTGYLYSTKEETFTTLCSGDYLYVYGKYLVCCNISHAAYSSGFINVSAYDAAGRPLTNYRTFVGTIANQSVVVSINVSEDGHIIGSYYYTKYAKNGKAAERMLIDGRVEAGSRLYINGYNNDGLRIETWTGTLAGNTINARFDNLYTGKSYDFTLVEQK